MNFKNKVLFKINEKLPWVYTQLVKVGLQWNDGVNEKSENETFDKDWKRKEGELVGGEFEPKDYQSDGQWLGFVYDEEEQKQNGVETMSCASQAPVNGIEVLEFRKWNKKPQYSKRFVAMGSGTTYRGNTPTATMDFIRTKGMCSEGAWGWGNVKSWKDFYKKPPQQVWDWAADWVRRYVFSYERLVYSYTHVLLKNLKRSPLPVAVDAWHKDRNGKYYRVSSRSNHFCLLVGYKLDDYWLVLDSYPPFIKKLRWDYRFDYTRVMYLRHRDEKFNTEALVQKKRDGVEYFLHVDDRGKFYKITDDFELVHIEKEELEKELKERLGKDFKMRDDFIRYLADVVKILQPINAKDFNKLIKK